MSKFRFTDKDFCDHPYFPDCDCINDCNGHPHAVKANALLDAHLATLERVYACPEVTTWGERDDKYDTHTALLFDVSPINEELK